MDRYSKALLSSRLISKPLRERANWAVKLPGLSVFLPAYNEQDNIARVVQRFCAVLPRITRTYEVLIVDDGSRDSTGEIADRLAVADSHVKVVRHGIRRGYGGAVISGLTAASLPFVLLCDGDGQFDPEDVGRLVDAIPEHDVVIGRRARRADHVVRRFNGRAWTILARTLFKLSITDMDCGFKLFRREFITGLDLHAHSAMITTELMARLAARGARICEIDVNHLPRTAGKPTGNNIFEIVRTFRELFALYRELKTVGRRDGVSTAPTAPDRVSEPASSIADSEVAGAGAVDDQRRAAR
jgi:glycosyltransferase involved in cell wall biosynthesis